MITIIISSLKYKLTMIFQKLISLGDSANIRVTHFYQPLYPITQTKQNFYKKVRIEQQKKDYKIKELTTKNTVNGKERVKYTRPADTAW